MKTKINVLPASYKDSSGFLYWQEGKLLRQINYVYKDDYELLMNSGLYERLVKNEQLISHREEKTTIFGSFKTIAPEIIPFLSYPYEWCFSQLKDAALLTLDIQKIAFDYNMSLKDASSFNIQFFRGKPIFIDTLSFERYQEGKPWVAYKQFCEQFLAPLTLTVYTDIRLNRLLGNYLGNIPLDLAVKLLPLKAKINPGIFLHLVLHAKSQKKYDQTRIKRQPVTSFNRQAFLELIESLQNLVTGLNLKPSETIWTAYENDHPSYDEPALAKKKSLVTDYLQILKPKTLWDIGANSGLYSRLACQMGIFTVSLDNDPTVVEQNYLQVKKNKEQDLLPLWIDILNPTPALGFKNEEKESLLERPNPDCILALALIHHLAIANNLPLTKIAQFFAKISRSLIIEFVPKEDKQVQILLQNREDIFPDYTPEAFEKEFGKLFTIKEKSSLPDSKRTLYLMTTNL